MLPGGWHYDVIIDAASALYGVAFLSGSEFRLNEMEHDSPGAATFTLNAENTVTRLALKPTFLGGCQADKGAFVLCRWPAG